MSERTDRELLELAAKAADVVIDRSAFNGGGAGNSGFTVTGDMVIDWHNGTTWNPLTDDGDALRLLVNRRFTVKDFAPHDNPEIAQAPADAALWGMVEIWREDDNDPLHVEWYKAGADRYAATRRAIVRAAAAIGAKE